jgi:hypothetical protein
MGIFDGVSKGGTGAFPSAPQAPGAPGGFMGSPIMQRLTNGAPQDIPGFSMKTPGMMGLMQQQGQWMRDNGGRELFGSMSAMGQQPSAPSISMSGGGGGGAPQPTLNDVLEQIAARYRKGF